MKKLRRWINGLNVRAKLVFYGYLTITPVLVLICTVLLLHNYQKSMGERLKTDMENVNAVAESIHVLQQEIKDFSTYICINDQIYRLLTAKDTEALNTNARLWFEEAPLQIVRDMIALKGHIKTIAIYPENGLRPYLYGLDGSVYLPDIESVQKTQVYHDTLEHTVMWRNVPEGASDTYLTNRDDKIVLYRKIPDRAQKKTLGYIVIGVSQQRFLELCQGTIDDNEGILIIDPIGGELVRLGTIDRNVEQYLLGSTFMKQNYRNRQAHFIYGNYDIICCQTGNDASIVCKTPRYSLQTQMLQIAYMPVSLLAGMLIGLLPLLLIISNTVTRPLGMVSEAIRKFSLGDFEQCLEIESDDEIGEVAHCFNKMVEDIRTLINENYVITLKEQESELAVLQAQINPHFLYNTLDSLYWQAMDKGNDETAESILALSQLFRLVLAQGKSEIYVSQEAELIARYLQLQKVRFSQKLNYEIEIQEEIKKVKIPKLILQPFVENAIVHGFENVSTPCFLKISGRIENDRIRFEVSDSGIGMRQDQIDALWTEEPTQYARQRIGRYAVKNIRERLQLKYHDNFSLEIKSKVGKGTTVILTVPFEEEHHVHKSTGSRG